MDRSFVALGVLAGLLSAGCGSEREATVQRATAGEEVEREQSQPQPSPSERQGEGEGDGEPAGAIEEEPRTLAEATTLELRVDEPPHPVPEGAPHAVVHLPAGLRVDRPLQLVVFLHGWNGCARVLALPGRVACAPRRGLHDGWGLIERHEAAGPNAIFVVPQLSFMRRSSSPGEFAEQGAFRTFLDDLLGQATAALPGGARDIADVGSITLVAHSAGWKTAEALVRSGGVDVDRVVLFDALYDDGVHFANWLLARPERRLVSVIAATGEPRHHTRLLLDFVRARDGEQAAASVPADELRAALDAHRMVAFESPHPHGAIPARHLTEVLEALQSAGPTPTRPRPAPPPETAPRPRR